MFKKINLLAAFTVVQVIQIQLIIVQSIFKINCFKNWIILKDFKLLE